MLANFEKYVAFRCPDCGETTVEQINLFDFSGDSEIALACSCEAECVTIAAAKNQYQISVSCSACLDVHTFPISRKAFWNKELTAFYCPTAQIGIISVGDQALVETEMNEQSAALEKLLGEMGLSPLFNEGNFTSDEVMLQTIDRIHEIANGGNIFCTCGSHDISFRVNYDNVELVCEQCDAVEVIAAATEGDLLDIMRRSIIVIGGSNPEPSFGKTIPMQKKMDVNPEIY